MVPWKDVVWFSGRINKFAILVWMAINNGLKARMFLAGKTPIPDTSCVLCNSSNEDSWHLFLVAVSAFGSGSLGSKFGCSVSRRNSLLEQVEQLLLGCDASRKDNLTLAKLCFQSFIANIWYERNSRIFSSTTKSEQLVGNIRARALFLGFDTSPSIAAAWDLPHSTPSIPRRMLPQPSGEWTLLIITHHDFSVGIVKSLDRRSTTVISVEHSDPFSAASKIIHYASTLSLHQFVLFSSLTIRKVILHPMLSDWKLRFKARAAAAVFRNLGSHLLYICDDEAKL